MYLYKIFLIFCSNICCIYDFYFFFNPERDTLLTCLPLPVAIFLKQATQGVGCPFTACSNTPIYHGFPTWPCVPGSEHYLSLQAAHVHSADCRASLEPFSATSYTMDRSSILIWIGLLFASIGIILSFGWNSIFNYILRKVCAK
jgi:hypothetical protein